MLCKIGLAQNGLSLQRTNDIIKHIQDFKEDLRGPYKDIRWFCPDGSTLPPGQNCSQPGGIQRARYKDWVLDLGQKDHIYLGQILAGTDNQDFLDDKNSFSRVKQYILEQFLYLADDGWIQRKSRFYRGAMQDEDESAWGNVFLLWLLESKAQTEDNFYLTREMFKYIPHKKETALIQNIRAISKSISDTRQDFMPIRIKIHGNPSAADIESCKKYKLDNEDKLSKAILVDLDKLIGNMELFYAKTYKSIIENRLSLFAQNSSLRTELEYFMTTADRISGEELIMRSSDLLSLLKQKFLSSMSSKAKMNLMDISVEIEAKLLSDLGGWKANTLSQVLDKACYLSKISESTGYIFEWELEELMTVFSQVNMDNIAFDDVYYFYRSLKKNIQWGSGLVSMSFDHELQMFLGFERLVNGFVDDRIRSSVLLALGTTTSQLHDYINTKIKFKNSLFGKNTGDLNGVNPGYVRAKLKVVDHIDEDNFEPGAIYAFQNPPSDLLPVSGILSISEGNMVSHIQLLARNLGIPNSIITNDVFKQLRSYDEKEVFYAVSPKGGVVLKLAKDMDKEELALFSKVSIDENVVEVPISRLDLVSNRVLSINEVDASSSGVLCGPKAANFGKLKQLFPDKLVNGMVVPFSIFRDHMQQMVPGKDFSYWSFLDDTFTSAKAMEDSGSNSDDINKYCIDRLKRLSEFILDMPLKESFKKQMESMFQSEFGKNLGNIPVFLRSDTNMEDLKDFTGAGLNLTLFNLIDKDKIFHGIKKVWASPYSERSYKWRQKFLTNPLDVYPSILIIPSVFVDKSGVVISKDLNGDYTNALNVAFSQGVGGAVDGQKSEAWILLPNGKNILMSPSRDLDYKYLSSSGATSTGKTKLSQRLLSYDNIKELWKAYQVIREQMPSTGMNPPYDIELGFVGDNLYLFQIRPFVENKKAVSSSYLIGLDPQIPENLKIKINDQL